MGDASSTRGSDQKYVQNFYQKTWKEAITL